MALEEYADEIIPHLWLGSEFAGTSPLKDLQEKGISSVVVVGKGISVPYLNVLSYHQIPAYDIPGFSLLPYFQEACDFIDNGLSTGSVLVHCAQGVSRSATIVIAYLMAAHKTSRRDAEWRVRQKRKAISPKQDFLHQLDLWEKLNYSLHDRSTFSTDIERSAFEEYTTTYKKKFSLQNKIN